MNRSIAAVSILLAGCAGLCVAQNEPAAEPPRAEEPQASERSEERNRKAEREARRSRARERQTPNRTEPRDVFPGELPIKTTTPGTLDTSGRVLQDNRATPAPPDPENRHID